MHFPSRTLVAFSCLAAGTVAQDSIAQTAIMTRIGGAAAAATAQAPEVQRHRNFTDKQLADDLECGEHTDDRFSTVCPICYEDFAHGDRVTVGRCGHRVHKDCYATAVECLRYDCSACGKSMVRTMSEDFTVPEEPADDRVVGAAAEKDLYTVMVAYEGTKHVYTKEGVLFDAMDVKILACTSTSSRISACRQPG